MDLKKRMKQTEIKLGFDCNNHCVFCIQGDRRLKEPDLSMEEIKERLEEGKKAGIVSVVLTGGEPTFRPDVLLRTVEFAKGAGYETIEIQSNGVRFGSEDYCKKIAKAGATKISLSIHGSCAEEHDALTCNPGSWKKAMEGLDNFKRLGCRLKTNSVIAKSNYKSLPKIVSLLADTGVNEIQLSFINPVSLNDDEETIRGLVPEISKVASHIEKALRVSMEKKANTKVAAVPYCVVKSEYREHISPETVPVPHESIKRLEVRDYGFPNEIEGKFKKKECAECRHFGHCDGLWAKYENVFGSDEINPVSK